MARGSRCGTGFGTINLCGNGIPGIYKAPEEIVIIPALPCLDVYNMSPLTLDAENSDIVLDENDVDSGLENPIVALNDNYKERIRQNFNMNGAFTWNIVKNLSFRTDVGLDIYENDLKYFFGATTYESQNNTQAAYKNLPVTQKTGVDRRTFRNTNTLSYDFRDLLPGEHSLNFMIGQENVVIRESKTTARVEGFPDFYDAQMAFNFSAQGTPTKYDEFFYQDDKMLSVFGRLNYDYKGRYLFSGTLRADGSSKFARGNRWGYFPSVALGWRVVDYPLLKPSLHVPGNAVVSPSEPYPHKPP